MITSAYSKSSNFSGFNTMLQKFCMMICEIKLSTKRCTEFSWCLVDRVLVIILLWRAIFQNLYNYRNLNISRPVYLEKNSAHRFEGHICTKKLEEFFFFFKDLELFWRLQNHWFGPHLFPQTVILHFFSNVVI